MLRVADVMAQVHANRAVARDTLDAFWRALPVTRTLSPTETCADHALITEPLHRDPAMHAKRGSIVARALST